MPAISKIRFTNVVYENGGKRYNDETFQFDGHSGAIVLENGGGKTVFIQTALQAVVPHIELADRKIKETLTLENGAAHIAIEWILNDSPRRYAVTAVTLFIENNAVNSYKYAYEYGGEDANNIENIPFVLENSDKTIRPAGKGEILDYYQRMARTQMSAKMFDTITDYHKYIEENFKIIPSEWRKIGVINSAEGDVDKYFDGCKTTTQLLNKLLIPVVEEAIEGTQKNDFVKTFEKQREHFKKNKILLEQIRESQATREQLQQYIEGYAKYHQSEEAYVHAKGEVKALYQYVDYSLHKEQNRLLQLDEQLESLEKRTRVYDQRKLSMRIWEKSLVMEQVKLELKNTQVANEEIENQYNEKAARKQNIEITELNHEINTLAEQIKVIEEQLSKIDEDEELSDMKQELETNTSRIKGFLSNQLEGYNKEKQSVEHQKGRYEDEKTTTKSQLDENSQLISKFNGEKIYFETINQRLGNDMQQIAREILDRYEDEKVEERLSEWKNRITLLQEQSVKLQADMNKELEEKTAIILALEGERQKKEEVTTAHLRLLHAIEKNEEEQEKISVLIEPYMPNLYLNHSLYEKQSSIEKILIEKETYQAKIKEAALREERICNRLADSYQEASVYTADPLLVKICEELKQVTTYIELGTRYYENTLEDLSEDLKKAYQEYPFWAMTLITTEKDMENVRRRLDNYKKELTHPIILLTMDAFRGILLKNPKFMSEALSNPVFPELWHMNIKTLAFEEWKREILDRAKELTAIRIEEENALNALTAVRKQAYSFFREYSYESYEEAKKESSKLVNELETTKSLIKGYTTRLDEIEKNNQLFSKKLTHYTEEITVVSGKVLKANDYMAKARELQGNEAQYAGVLARYQASVQENLRLVEAIERLDDIISQLKDKLIHLDNEIEKILDKNLYREVKDIEAVYSELPLKVLEDQRKILMDKINGKNVNREGLVTKKYEKGIELDKNRDTLKLKEREARYQVEFVANYYQKELYDLIDEMKKLDNKWTSIKKELERHKHSLTVVATEKNGFEKDCVEKYGQIISFDQDLLSLQQALEEEIKSIKKDKDVLFKEKGQLVQREKALNEIVNQFRIHNGKHDFINPSVIASELQESTTTDFEYHPKEITEKYQNQLETLFFSLKKQEEVIESEKARFKRYCNTHIQDVKLKEMAISGIDKKRNYEELLEYGNRMHDIINQNIKIAEHSRRTSDKELQIFLEHLHTYVASVVDELDSIQRKTKISIEGNLKQIFTFDIPKWEEQSGKEELRKHIDWIIDQLENNKEVDAEDEVLTQKNLENWLSVRRLLQCLMGDQSIKIKCRKVTNDKKITSIPLSWESSNQWSGGEKWSKNMTLFLGILIYIAEKKQYLTSSEKKHRTVILDNPFGKASSKHVLDPVFFIAERLGFQIIALTAHAEGEFIRNYFPVVYSCRLRGSAEQGKQIMTKEKEIHYAYLKEHDPQSLIRFQEIEQVTIDNLLGM